MKARVFAWRSPERRWEGRVASPLKRRLEQSFLCARPHSEGKGTVSLSPQNIGHATQGAFGEDRLVPGETARAVRDRSRLPVTQAALVLTGVRGRPRDSLGVSFGLKEMYLAHCHHSKANSSPKHAISPRVIIGYWENLSKENMTS